MENGNGIAKHPVEATSWFRKSAEAGNLQGMVNYAINLANGKGTDKSEPEAASWYRKAAEGGNPGGMYGLAVALESGIGAQKDPGQAEQWYKKAADAGHVEARKRAERKLAATQSAAKAEMDTVALRQAAEGGSVQAMHDFGEALRLGSGVQLNVQEAIKWHKKAANAGVSSSMHALADIFENDPSEVREKTPSDARLDARSWYAKASALGHPEAQQKHSLDGRAWKIRPAWHL
jgi:uncharacterized protein